MREMEANIKRMVMCCYFANLLLLLYSSPMFDWHTTTPLVSLTQLCSCGCMEGRKKNVGMQGGKKKNELSKKGSCVVKILS